MGHIGRADGWGTAPVRDLLKNIHKALSILVFLFLTGLAFLAYRESTAANGLLLVASVLGVLALIAFLSIDKAEEQDRRAENLHNIIRDVHSLARPGLRFGKRGRADEGGTAVGTVSWSYGTAPITAEFAGPEVHRIDSATVEEARRMADEGASIDDICRMIDPGHDGNDRFHQEAFRRLVSAMLDQA